MKIYIYFADSAFPGFKKEKILLLVTDGVPYMKKAGRSLKVFAFSKFFLRINLDILREFSSCNLPCAWFASCVRAYSRRIHPR
jgi:hypothetical protein